MNNFFSEVAAMVTDPLMLRSLIAAVLVGTCAPVVGTYLVQRKLALMGDGIGHVALTGVAAGWLAGSMFSLVPNDVLAIPGAVIASIIGAILIEIVSARGRSSGDIALALLFYGGIAGGVLIISVAGGTSANLMGYLFGSITTVTDADLWLTVALCIVILLVGFGLRTALFAVCHDPEFAQASGMAVRTLNTAVAVTAALTVTVSMRIVGLLLVSALMIVPVAIAQLVTTSFRRTMSVGMVVGALACITGLSITYWVDVPPGATIVVLAIVAYAVVAAFHSLFHHRVVASPPPHADDVAVTESASTTPPPAGPVS